MARAIWTGTLSFGLVSIPVKLYPATVQRDVRFHQFQRGTGRRVRYLRTAGDEPERYVPPEPGPPAPAAVTPQVEHEPPVRPAASEGQSLATVSPSPPSPPPPGSGLAYEDLVKGYEVSPGRFVMVTPEELDELRPEADHSIQIEDFVDLADIDPIYFEKSYYVGPQRGVGAERPYALLVKAMEDSAKVAVGRFVLRSKEYLAAIRPMRSVIVMETLFYWDEVRPVEEVENLPDDLPVSERELAIARQLIDALSSEWDPTRYVDRYRERVQELIEHRAAGLGGVVEEVQEAPAPRVADLMEALKASVEAAQEAKGEGQRPATPPRKRGRSGRSA